LGEREDKEFKAIKLTGLFELPIEFTPSINLYSPYGERTLFAKLLKKSPGQIGCGLRIYLGKGEAGKNTGSGELLVDLSWKRTDVKGIDCHKITGELHGIALGHRILGLFLRHFDPLSSEWFAKHTPSLEVTENSPHRRGRYSESLFAGRERASPYPGGGMVHGVSSPFL